ncbi:hypothetical protein AURDEDRAFT_128074 [Auricularia subglabra TFB-10046 SS5]|uniref:F-box domain-containing protein n=1 Tax=Auricularia subglabra (strain TFB-10046 / SS5) TaxID=717982 RepID=J0D1I5_AURST|nr:hypothetical protein AURDEDRAFT_128074 [Auricularia subglabra TFB-10046 SS5]
MFPRSTDSDSSAPAKEDGIYRIPLEHILEVMQHFSQDDLRRVSKVSHYLRDAASNAGLCMHAVLNPSHHRYQSRVKTLNNILQYGKQTGKLNVSLVVDMHCPFRIHSSSRCARHNLLETLCDSIARAMPFIATLSIQTSECTRGVYEALAAAPAPRLRALSIGGHNLRLFDVLSGGVAPVLRDLSIIPVSASLLKKTPAFHNVTELRLWIDARECPDDRPHHLNLALLFPSVICLEFCAYNLPSALTLGCAGLELRYLEVDSYTAPCFCDMRPS